MFTGIVTSVGVVESIEPTPESLKIVIRASLSDLVLGESIAVDGACLTVTGKGRGWFGVDVVRTSLGRTRFGEYRPGTRVNLERALRVGDRLGGHLVQGHVDGVAEVVGTLRQRDAVLVDLRLPPEVAHVTIPLGSITVNGVSLTVNAGGEAGDRIQVSLIPFTLQHTTLGELQQGMWVHVEGDTLGKYLDALVRRRAEGSPMSNEE